LPLAFALQVFNRHIVAQMETNRALYASQFNFDAYMANQKHVLALGPVVTLIYYLAVSPVPAIYVAVIELIAFPIRRYVLPDRKQPKRMPTA
jgi:hypothetical protein